MPTNTKNFSLVKPTQEEFYNVDVSNNNMDIIDGLFTKHLADESTHVYYADDTGTANAKLLTIPEITSYKKGMAIAFTNLVTSTGDVTINVNGLGTIPVTKTNGSAASLKADIPYTVRHNGTFFILQGEGGEYGDATEGDVLKGKTIGTDAGLKTGTLELTGNVTAGDVLSGKTFYNTNAKTKQTGTMPNRAGQGFDQQTWKKGVGGASPEYIQVFPKQAGYYDTNSFLQIMSPALQPALIKKGANIFDVIGTLDVASLGGKRFATGTSVGSYDASAGFQLIQPGGGIQNAAYLITMTGMALPFIPTSMMIIALNTDNLAVTTVLPEQMHTTTRVLVSYPGVSDTYGDNNTARAYRLGGSIYMSADGFRMVVGVNPYYWNGPPINYKWWLFE